MEKQYSLMMARNIKYFLSMEFLNSDFFYDIFLIYFLTQNNKESKVLK